MNHLIRRADLDDIDDLAPLFDAYRQFYAQTSQPDACRRFLTTRLQNDESVIFIAGASDSRALTGFTQLYPSFSSVRMQRIWWLNDLYVTPLARKQGVGEALMAAAREHATKTSAAGLILETAHDNLNAQCLYRRMGYQRVDPDSQFYWLAMS